MCVCGRLRSTTTRETHSISMSDVVKEPHQTYIYTQKEPPVNYTIEWLHEKGYVQRIYTWEIHMNDWHLSTEISQKNIHDGTTQSTTEIGKYNHRQFTHRCSTSRSSQAGRWSHIDTRQSTGGTSSNQISQTTGSGYVVVSIVAPISCPSGFHSIAAIDVMKRLGCWLCIVTLASTPSLSCNLKS